MRTMRARMLVSGCCFLALTLTPGRSAEPAGPYVADPDPQRPTLHVQPPALTPPVSRAAAPRRAPSGTINGITVTDVMTAAGFDLAGLDFGNEPAIAVNPANPNQLVLTSFSGSNWASGGNSSLFYSGDSGASWSYAYSVPPPTGTTTNINCPCDQNMDWGRNGRLYATFLHYDTGAVVQSVYSAETADPVNPAAWAYPLASGLARRTNLDALVDVDQPWLTSGPMPGDMSGTNVCVAYDNFDAAFLNSEVRAADSPGSEPLDFTADQPANGDGQKYNDGMNPGSRIAVGPTGLIFGVFQRYVTAAAGGVKQLTYLVSVSADGGQTWSVANSDHASGAKIVAANVYSFQGNGSKVGGVNALLGGITAIGVDPSNGTVWIAYGSRSTTIGKDVLWLVPVTYSAGNLTVGTRRAVSAATTNAYLPAVAVLPNGEVGVLFTTWSGTQFTTEFVQTADGGSTFAKATTLATFTSPFADNGASNQRILGDYVQLKASGCDFVGAFPARGDGVNSVDSIDPYFMRAPAATTCVLPSLSHADPEEICAGGPDLPVTVVGSNFNDGTTGRVNGVARPTAYIDPTSVSVQVRAVDIAVPGTSPIDTIGAAPAGILSGSVPLVVQAPAASPGSSLLVDKADDSVSLTWAAAAAATSYPVKRCTATGPCTPTTVGVASSNGYAEPTLNDGQDYWYLVASANSCGEVP